MNCETSTSTLQVHDNKATCTLSRMSTIGERVREAMEVAGLSQSELARRIGKKQQAIQQILSGTTQRSRYLPEIARETRCSLDWLLTGVGPKRLYGPEAEIAEGQSAPDYHSDSVSVEIQRLLAVSTPRSQSALTRIAEAAAQGRLTDEDLELLERVAKRFERS